MKDAICQYCSKLFIVSPGSYGKFCSLSCGTIFRNEENFNKLKSKYDLNPVGCKNCQNVLSYEKRKNKYCSKSCASKITNQIDRKRGPSSVEKAPYSKIKWIWCSHTNQYYSNRNKDGSFRRSSPYIKTQKEKYYNSARFRFNVYHYPDEFDLSLIEKHGWYTCPGRKRKNQSKNILGISRDHIISISYGFLNNIDPKIISHPANCRLMLHSDNKNKHTKCELTIEELLEKITRWNKKYIERRIGLEPTTSCLEGKSSPRRIPALN